MMKLLFVATATVWPSKQVDIGVVHGDVAIYNIDVSYTMQLLLKIALVLTQVKFTSQPPTIP